MMWLICWTNTSSVDIVPLECKFHRAHAGLQMGHVVSTLQTHTKKQLWQVCAPFYVNKLLLCTTPCRPCLCWWLLCSCTTMSQTLIHWTLYLNLICTLTDTLWFLLWLCTQNSVLGMTTFFVKLCATVCNCVKLCETMWNCLELCETVNLPNASVPTMPSFT